MHQFLPESENDQSLHIPNLRKTNDSDLISDIVPKNSQTFRHKHFHFSFVQALR